MWASWMQLDLGEERWVSGIVTQDRQDHAPHYVTTFTVEACVAGSLSGGGKGCTEWTDVDGGAGRHPARKREERGAKIGETAQKKQGRARNRHRMNTFW